MAGAKGKKKVKRKAKKKAAKKKVASSAAAPEAARLAGAVEETERALEKVAGRLAEARERVTRADVTARQKRTQAAHVVAEQAREAAATINSARMDVTVRLTAARDAIAKPSGKVDWQRLEEALRNAFARYEEALGSYDRRIGARSRDRRNH